MTDDDFKPFTPVQFQQLLEYISAQVMCGVLEHEVRIHAPTSNEGKKRLNTANDIRKKVIAELRAKLVRE